MIPRVAALLTPRARLDTDGIAISRSPSFDIRDPSVQLPVLSGTRTDIPAHYLACMVADGNANRTNTFALRVLIQIIDRNSSFGKSCRKTTSASS